MLRINEICIKREKNSEVDYSVVQQCIEYVMQKNASAIKYRIIVENDELNTILETSISFQTVNKILKALDKKWIRLRRFSLERKEIGPFRRGHLEIIVF